MDSHCRGTEASERHSEPWLWIFLQAASQGNSRLKATEAAPVDVIVGTPAGQIHPTFPFRGIRGPTLNLQGSEEQGETGNIALPPS